MPGLPSPGRCQRKTFILAINNATNMLRINFYKYMHLLALALLSGSSAIVAQDITPARLQEDWQQYQSRTYQEKIFVHPDKTFFLAGETLWIKIYNLDAYRHTPGLSIIAYAELLDKDQQPVLQSKIHLQKGKGAGSFLLPASIPSGNYQLRCYTSWMKNFDPGLFFHQ